MILPNAPPWTELRDTALSRIVSCTLGGRDHAAHFLRLHCPRRFSPHVRRPIFAGVRRTCDGVVPRSLLSATSYIYGLADSIVRGSNRSPNVLTRGKMISQAIFSTLLFFGAARAGTKLWDGEYEDVG